MWCYRKLLKISWVDKVQNKENSNLVKKERNLYASKYKEAPRQIDKTHT